MPTMTLPPQAVAPPPLPMRWTCEEFYLANEAGAFAGRRPMLIDGVILEQGPMNEPHAIAVELIDPTLRAVFGVGWRIRCQLPLKLGLETDPFPDFAVMAGFARGSGPHPTTASLVVEVTDTTYAFDTGGKRLLYARAGIPEYWVVDVVGRRLLVYRDPQNGDYATQQTLGPTDSITPLAVPTAVSVADLFE